MIHIPASHKVSYLKVKDFMSDRSIEMGCLKAFGILKGEVTPFVEPFWSMRHIIDDSVFDRDWMTTNDSTRQGFVKFNPKVLHEIQNLILLSRANYITKRFEFVYC